jgi:hypothetical protein
MIFKNWRRLAEGRLMMLCLSDKGQVSVSRGRSSACRILRNPASAHSSPLANQRGIRVPLQVSLICTDPDPAFAWSAPALSHIHWEAGPLVRRINRWAGKCQPGKARPCPGGSTGPAPARSPFAIRGSRHDKRRGLRLRNCGVLLIRGGVPVMRQTGGASAGKLATVIP